MPTPNDDINQDISSSPSGENPQDPAGAGEGGENNPQRNAEARIHELLAKNKEFEDKLKQMEDRMAPPPPPGSNDQAIKPEVKQAVESLKGLGFTDEAKVDEKVSAAIKTLEDRLALGMEHQRLETSYSGADGKPKYVRADIEKYMREKGVYNPEVAYDQLHKMELLDFALKEAEKKPGKPYIEKSGTSVTGRDSGIITKEEIRKRVEAGDRTWYEKNRNKILELTRQGQLS